MNRILVAASALVAASGGGTSAARPDCPPGRTSLDGTCVSQQIADYVGCIRAPGAVVASDNSKSLSAAAGFAGTSASTQAEVKDSLEKKYAGVSDANALQIIHDCSGKTQAASASADLTPTSVATTMSSPAPAPPHAMAATTGPDVGAPPAGGSGFSCFRFVFSKGSDPTQVSSDECFASRSACDKAHAYWAVRAPWEAQGNTLVRTEPCWPATEAFCHTDPNGHGGWTCRGSAAYCAASVTSVPGASCTHSTSWPH